MSLVPCAPTPITPKVTWLAGDTAPSAPSTRAGITMGAARRQHGTKETAAVSQAVETRVPEVLTSIEDSRRRLQHPDDEGQPTPGSAPVHEPA